MHKQNRRSTTLRTARHSAQSLLSLTLGLLLLDQGAGAQSITPDRTAPTTQQPVIGITQNGVPVILITNPTAGGVSRNTFAQFSVSNRGVIFNNATTGTNTVLGGYINANPFLGSGAKIIVAEVTGGNPSALNGYVEIGGQKADLVIANPFGITVNGTAFLNANRVALTTGQVLFDKAGGVQGYLVANGNVGVGEFGVNASNLDYFDIISRTAQIDGPVYAKNARVLLGQNTVDAASMTATVAGDTTTTSGTTTPSVALDVGANGSIYGGTVFLVSTEKGVGVNNAGVIQGEQNLHISADGKISLDGRTISGGDATIKGQEVSNSGVTYAAGKTEVKADNKLDNTGLIGSGNDLKADAQTIDSSGTLVAGLTTDGQLKQDGTGQLTTTAQTTSLTGSTLSGGAQTHQAGQLDIAGQMASATDLTLTTSQLNNAGHVTAAGNATVNSTTTVNSGAIAAGNTLVVKTDTLTGAGGTLYGKTTTVTASTVESSGTVIGQESVDLSADSASISQDGGVLSGGTTKVTVTQGLKNAGTVSGQTVSIKAADTQNSGAIQADQLSVDTPHLSNSGSITSVKDLTLNPTDLKNSGVIASSGTLTVTTDTLNGAGGTLSGGKTTNVQAKNIPSSGTIIGQEAAQVTADQLTIDADGGVASGGTTSLKVGGELKSAGQILGQQVQVAADTTHNSGQIQANDLTIQSRVLENTGAVTAAGNASISADQTTNTGVLAAGKNMSLTTTMLDGAGGTISGADTTVSARNIASTGTIIGQDKVAVTTDAATIEASGGVASGGQTSLKVGSELKNAGQVLGQDVQVSADHIQNSGLMQGSTFSVQTRLLDNIGTLTSGADLKLDTEGLNNQGTIAAGKALTINTQSLNGAGGTLYGQTTSVTAKAISSVGTVIGQDGVTLTTDALNIGAGEGIISGGTTNLNVNGALSNAGQIQGETVQVKADTTQNSGQLKAGTLGFQTRLLQNSGDITAASALNLETEATTNSGTIASGGDLTVKTGTLNGAGGTLYGKTTTINAKDVTAIGTVIGQDGVNLTTDALNIGTGEVIASGGTTALNVTGQLSNAGVVQGQTVQAQADNIQNSGQIQADDLIIQSRILGNSGSATATNNATVTATDTTNSGTLAAGNDLNLTTGTLTGTDGTLYGKTTSLTAKTVNSSGTVVGQDTVTVTADTLNIDEKGGVASGGTASLNVSGNLTNAGVIQGQTVQVKADNAQNNGQIQANDLTIQTRILGNAGSATATHNADVTATDTTNTGTLAAGDALNLTTGTLEGVGGTLYGKTASVVAKAVNSSGTIVGQENATVQADTLNIDSKGGIASAKTTNLNVTGQLSNAGTIQGETVQVKADSVQNSGLIQAADLTIQSRILDNSGSATATNDATVTTTTTTNSGTLAAGNALNLTTDTLTGASGTLYGKTTTVTAKTVNSSGTVVGQDAVTVQADQLSVESAGNIASGGTTTLNVAGQFSNAGTVQGQTVQVKADSTQNSGQVQANDLTINTRVLDNSGSATAAGNVTVTATDTTNSGTLAAGNALAVTTDSLSGAGGTLYGKTTTINARNVSSTGVVVGQDSATIHADTLTIDDKGGIASGGTTALNVTGQLSNTGAIQGQTVQVKADSTQNSGQVQANDLIIQSRVLDNSGSATATNNATVKATDTTNSGTLAAGNDLNLTTSTLDGAGGTLYGKTTTVQAGAVNSTGSVVGQDSATVQADTLNIEEKGGVASGKTTVLNVKGQLTNAGGIQGQTVQTTADNVQNSGQIQAGDLTIQSRVLGNSGSATATNNAVVTATDTTNSGTLAAGNALSLTTDTLAGAGGTLYGKATTVKAGTVSSTGTIIGQEQADITANELNIDAQGSIASNNLTHIAVTKGLKNAGTIAGNTVDLTAATTSNTGTVQADRLNLTTSSLDNAGRITAVQDLALAPTALTNSGTIATSGHLDLKVDTLAGAGGTLYGKTTNVQARDIASTGSLIGADGLALRADQLNVEAGGSVASGATTDLQVKGTLVNAGAISGQVINLTADTANNSGQIQANTQAIQARLLENMGSITAAQNATVTTTTLTNSGTLAAGEQLALNTDDLTNSGQVYGKANTVQAKTIANNGQLVGGDGLTVNADTLTVGTTGIVASNGTTTLDVSGDVLNTGQIAGTDVTLNAGTLTNSTLDRKVQPAQGIISASNNLTVKAGKVDGNGVLSAGNAVDITAQTFGIQAGGTVFGKTTTLTADQATIGGNVYAGDALNVQAGQLNVSGTLASSNTADLKVADTLTNTGVMQGSTVLVNADTVNNAGQAGVTPSGQIASSGDLTLNARVLNNNSGALIGANGTNTINTTYLNNEGGTIYGDKTMNLNAANILALGTVMAGNLNYVSSGDYDVDGTVNAREITFSVTNTLRNRGNITANSVTGTSGNFENYGQIQTGVFSVKTGGFTNTGSISVGDTATVDATTIDNSGTLASNNTLDVKASSVNNTGLLYAAQQGTLTTDSLSNSGKIYGAENFKVTVQNPLTNASSGEIKAGATLDLNANGSLNNQGVIEAGTLNLNTTSLSNSNTINGGTVNIQASDISNTRTISGGLVDIESGTLTNDSAAALVMASAGGNLSITTTGNNGAADLLNTNGATIYSGGNMQLNSNYLRNFSSTIEAEGNLDIKSGKVENTRTLVVETKQTAPVTTTTPLTDLSNPVPTDITQYQRDHYGFGETLKSATTTKTVETATDSVTSQTPEAKILAGGNLVINAPIENFASTISAGRNLSINSTQINSASDINNAPDFLNYGVELKTIEKTNSKETYLYDVRWCQSIYALGGCLFYDYGHVDVPFSRTLEPTLTTTITQTFGAQVTARGNVFIETRNLQNGTAPDQTVIVPGNANNPVTVGGTNVGKPDGTQTGAIPDPNTPMPPASKDVPVSGADQVAQQPINGAQAPGTTPVTGSSNIQPREVNGVEAPQGQTIATAGTPQATSTTAPTVPGQVSTNAPTAPGTRDTSAPTQPGAVGTSPTQAPGQVPTSATGQPSAEQTPGPTTISVPDFSITIPANAMYTVNKAPNLPLVTTSDTVTGGQHFTDSSEFFPGETARRIGDGFYEQKLVRDQLLSLQGFNLDQGTLEATYREMLQNGAEFARAQGIRTGATLTAEQQKALTKDIVVLVERTVQTASGPQTVLVPTVYLASGSSQRPAGATIMAGGKIDIKVSGDVTNTGNVIGNNVKIEANNILNFKGLIQAASETNLIAKNDITNASGKITGGQAVYIDAGHDFNNLTLSQKITAPGATTTVFDPTATVSSDGLLSIKAGNNINFAGAAATAQGDMSLNAGNNVNLFDIRKVQEQTTSSGSRKLDLSVGSTLASNTGGISVTAGNALTTIGTGLQAGGDIALKGNTVNLLEGRNIFTETQNMHYTAGGFLSSTTKDATITQTMNMGSATTIMGKNVSVVSQGDLNSRGTIINATDGGRVDLQSTAGKVNTTAMQNITTIKLNSSETTSGLSFGKGGGFNISLGTNSTDTTSETEIVQNVNGQINTKGGTVVIDGAKGVNRTGLDIINPGDKVGINGNGYGINETPAMNSVTNKTQTDNNDASLTIGLSGKSLDIAMDGLNTAGRLAGSNGQTAQAGDPKSPATFGVITPPVLKDGTMDLFKVDKPETDLTATGTTSANGEEQKQGDQQNSAQPRMNSNLQIALGTHLARDAYDFAKSLQKTGPQDTQGLRVSATVGVSQTSTTTTTTQTTAVGNTTSAADIIYSNNMKDGSMPVSDINVIGSTINGGTVDGKTVKANSVTFDTKGNVFVGSSQDTSRAVTSSQNSSVQMGVTFGQGGNGVTLSGSAGDSNSQIQSTTNNNTKIDTNNFNVTANNFTLQGANVNTVDANIDVNKLIVRSAQDTGSITNSNNQVNAGVTVGTGVDVNLGASTTNGNGTYRSVQDQTTLNISGNYDINTKQTIVDGAAINATPGKGNLTTEPGGLIITNQQNVSNYSTNTLGGSLTVGTSGVSGSPNIGGKNLNNSGTTYGAKLSAFEKMLSHKVTAVPRGLHSSVTAAFLRGV